MPANNDLAQNPTLAQLTQDILSGIANSSGESFFTAITHSLAQAIGSDYTFIGRLNPGALSVRTIAFCAGDTSADNFVYELPGTPCQEALDTGLCLIPRDATTLYPADPLLREMNIEGYVGMPLVSQNGTRLGIVIALYKQPIAEAELVSKVFELFAGRISASIENHELNQALRSSLSSLETYQNDLEKRVHERTAELVTAQRAASDANAAKSSFLARLSHEIRTPINGILGVTQLLQQTPLDPMQRHYVDVMQTTTDTLLGLLNDLLDYAKIESGEVELASQVIDLPQALRQCAEPFQHEPGDNLKLQLSLEPEVPRYMLGDEERLQQLVRSLLSTAFRTSRSGTIELRARQTDSELRELCISIHYPFQQAIDDPFDGSQQSLIRAFSGNGIHLTICKGIVEAMGGSIRHRQDDPSSSYFEVMLPVTEVNRGLSPTGANAHILADAPPALGHLRVLIAEDISVNQMVLAGLLESLGIVSADMVENGQQALDQVTRSDQADYDVVLMDCEMPVMDGITACRRIREWERREGRPAVPIFAVSAHVFPATVKECEDAGMNGHLPKPLELAVLARTLKTIKPH